LSPILVRPVREQLEHDRVIRLLQAKYKRKFEVAINPGNEQTTPVGPGTSPWYPDLVLQSADRARRLLGVVEVETAESVNNLEAMSQWAALSKLRAPFHLYVPSSSVDTTRRLCTGLQIAVAEIWAYNALGDQMRFTLIHRAPQATDGKGRAATPAAPPAPARRATPAPARASRTPAARTPSRRAAATSATRRGAAKKTKTSRGAVRTKAPGPSRTQKRK
jgi:hypothetical protein